jgi:5-methylcytosine-specific restriction endonuclease McrA
MKSLIGEKLSKTFVTKYKDKEIKIYPIGTPQTTHYVNVRSKFEKSEWDLIRKRVYKNSNYKCEICGEKGTDQGYKWAVECHEIWDYDFETEAQILQDFISLCPLCHKIVHYGLTQHLYESGKMNKEVDGERYKVWTLRR